MLYNQANTTSMPICKYRLKIFCELLRHDRYYTIKQAVSLTNKAWKNHEFYARNKLSQPVTSRLQTRGFPWTARWWIGGSTSSPTCPHTRCTSRAWSWCHFRLSARKSGSAWSTKFSTGCCVWLKNVFLCCFWFLSWINRFEGLIVKKIF